MRLFIAEKPSVAKAFAKAALSQLSYIPVAVLIVAIRSRYVNDYAYGLL